MYLPVITTSLRTAVRGDYPEAEQMLPLITGLVGVLELSQV